MNYVIGIIVIIIGVSVARFPEDTLGMRDTFRVKGKANYTDLAITLTQIGGVILMIAGIFYMFSWTFNDVLKIFNIF